MTPQELKNLESMLDLFTHEGWKVLHNEIKVNHDTLRYSLADCENDKFPETKGYVKGLAYLLSIEDVAKYAYQSQTEESNADL